MSSKSGTALVRKRVASGMCARCGRCAHKYYCDGCVARKREERIAYRNRRFSEGFCTRCAAKREEDKFLSCEQCRRRARGVYWRDRAKRFGPIASREFTHLTNVDIGDGSQLIDVSRECCTRAFYGRFAKLRDDYLSVAWLFIRERLDDGIIDIGSIAAMCVIYCRRYYLSEHVSRSLNIDPART
jgi:hypothetical protein